MNYNAHLQHTVDAYEENLHWDEMSEHCLQLLRLDHEQSVYQSVLRETSEAMKNLYPEPPEPALEPDKGFWHEFTTFMGKFNLDAFEAADEGKKRFNMNMREQFRKSMVRNTAFFSVLFLLHYYTALMVFLVLMLMTTAFMVYCVRKVTDKRPRAYKVCVSYSCLTAVMWYSLCMIFQ